METQNLQQVIDGVGLYDPDSPTAAAQKELNELQRLAEVVKGFIEDYGITCRSELKTIDYDEALDLMVDICDIVGYHKE